MALHKIHEVHKKENWDLLRQLNYRYVGQENIEGGMARVDRYDDAKDTQIMVYSPVNLLPDALFWTD